MHNPYTPVPWVAAPSTPTGTPHQRDELSLTRIRLGIRAHRVTVVALTAATVLLAAVFTWLQRPIYQSDTTILARDGDSRRDLVGQLGPVASLPMVPGLTGGSRAIQTDLAVLRSRSIAEDVVDSLALQVSVEEPRRPRSTVLSVTRVPRSAPGGLYDLRLQNDGRYRVSGRGNPGATSPPDRATPAVPIQLGGATLVLKPELARRPPPLVRIRVAPFRAAVGQVRKNLEAENPDPSSQVIAVRYRSPDPEVAAAVPTVATRRFIAYKEEVSASEATTSVRFLREQVARYARELEAAESRLRAFRESAALYDASEQASEQVRRLAEMQGRRDELRAESQSLGKLLERVRASASSADHTSAYRQLAAYPVFFANPAVQNVLHSLNDLENERAKLLVNRTASNRDVAGIDQRVRELETELYRTAVDYSQSLNGQIASIDSALGEFSQELATIPAREVTLARLARQQKLLEQVYTLLQTRLKEAEIEQAGESVHVRVLDAALVPEKPVLPRPLFNLGVAGVFGLMLGISAALGQSLLDGRVHTREDILQATAGIPVIGTIPRIRRSRRSIGRRAGSVRSLRALAGSRQSAAPLSVAGPAAEAYRALRTTIILADPEHPPRCIVLTSAAVGDGKSLSAANLAVSFAEQGMATLLIDGDLRSGKLHRVLDVPPEPGLSELLQEPARAARSAVRSVTVGRAAEPLHFLPAGAPPSHPAELLGSERMVELLDEFRGAFAFVVIDVPPLGVVTDAALVGKHADTTLLVTRAGATDVEALRETVLRLRQLHVSVGGVVLNDVTDRTKRYAYGV